MSDFIQYTIRNVPPAADAKLRAQAKKQGVSLNKLLLSKIGASKPASAKPKIYHDLDWFIGSASPKEANELNNVIMEARRIDRDRAQAEYEAEKARGEWD